MPLLELAYLLPIAATAFLMGRRVVAFAGVRFVTPAGHVASATALGLGLLGYVVLGVGLFGRLSLGAVAVVWCGLLVALHARVLLWRISHASLGDFERDRAGGLESPVPADLAAPSSVRIGAVFQCAIAAICGLGSLAGALAPPTAGDAMCYHLEIPKRFVQLGAVQFLPLTDNSLFPFLMEMLYTLALMLRGPELAALMHWLIGLLFALAVIELAAPVVGHAGSKWAGVIALAVPGVTNQMAAPLNDVTVALYGTLMVLAWRRWSASRDRNWLVLTGVFAGLGLSVKLVAAAMVIVIVGAVMFGEWRQRGMKSMLVAVATLVAVIGVTGGVWYARSWYHLGNPVYPYFNAVFGQEAHTASTLRTAHGLLVTPWVATMHPEEFGGRGVQFGAVFLALLPGLICIRPATSRLSPLLWIALAYGLIWFAVRQDLRFLLPVVPMLAVGVVALMMQLRTVRTPVFALAVICLAGLLTFQALIVVKRARPCLRVALGLETRAAYLARHEPTYEISRFVNTELPPSVRLISQDFRCFYFEPETVREAALYRHVPYTERGDALVEYLGAQGFSHILLVESFNPASAVYEQDFTERLGAALERLREIYRGRFASPHGDRRAYRLFEIPQPTPVARDANATRQLGVGN